MGQNLYRQQEWQKAGCRGLQKGPEEKTGLSCSVPNVVSFLLGEAGLLKCGVKAMKKVFLKQEDINLQDLSTLND